MTEPAVEDLINFTFSQTDNSSIGTENSYQPFETSNISYDFNIDLNKTFDLNKCKHIKASCGIETDLEPFNKYKFDCTSPKKNVLGKLSKAESLDCLESDESLGILPDLLKDEMTFDVFSSELGFSNEVQDDINSEVNENSASLTFSPPGDSQFNRISLFLKNISTPLPNFVNDRRCSSTPKVSVASQFVENIQDSSSLHFLPDEKEEPITGSYHIKFETDFNLDDLKTVKPLTSTYKTFSPPQLSAILSEWGEQTDFRSAVNLKKTPETIKNKLNVTQTFSHNTKDLFFCDNQNVNILDNTFQIEQPVFVESANAVVSLDCSIPSTRCIAKGESNNCSEKRVQMLDSTFAIPVDEIHCNVDCEKTFVIDFNSAIDSEISSKSICKDKRLNETHVLETDSIEFYSKQQEALGNVTFTKESENDSQTSLEHCNYSHGTVFKPMTQILEKTFCRNDLKPILEETFSENDLNEMLAHSENGRQSINSKNQPGLAEIFNIKASVTFSEKVEVHPESKITQNDSLMHFALPNSPKALANNIFHEAGENFFNNQINLTKSEIDPSNEKSLSFALQSIRNTTFPKEMDDRANQEIEKNHEIDSTENVGTIIEIVSHKSPKALASTTFSQRVGGEICISDQINLTENDLSNKMVPSVAFQSKKDVALSEEINERANQEIDRLYKRDSSENIGSIIELMASKSQKIFASDTFDESERKISYHSEIDHTENEYDPSKLSHSDPLQSIDDTIFSETNEKSCVIIDKFYEGDSIQNKSSNELEPSLMPKPLKNYMFPDRFQVANILKVNVFQDSNCIEKDASNLQTIYPRKTAFSVNLNQCDNYHAETSFPRKTENDCLPRNAPGETEFCTRSILEGDCHEEILPKSFETFENAAISQNTDELRNEMNSNENDKVQLSQNSLKEMTDVCATFSEKTCKVWNEQISIQSEINEFETSLNSQNEVANIPFSGLVYEDVKPEMKKSQHDQDSLGEASSNLKMGLKDAFSRKAMDVSNSSLKSCPRVSKIVKNGLMKPTKIVYPKKVTGQSNGILPVTKSFFQPIDRRSSTFDFNCTLNLSDNSTHKSLSKNFNRRLTLSCSAESDTNNSKCKNDFKRSFGIPSKLGTKSQESYFQKSRLDSKYSNGYLKDINTLNGKQNLLLQPNSIPSKDPKLVKSVAVAEVNAKEPISSRLSLPGKLPLKSLKMKEYGLKSTATLSCTAENTNKVISCPKVVDQPGKEKIPGNGINNSNSVKNYSKNSVGTNLPRKLATFSNIPNRTCNSKSVVKEKSAAASNFRKPNSLKSSGSINLSNINTKLKFSSLPKVQPHLKVSSDRSESNGGVIKRPAPLNKKSNVLTKPCAPEDETVQYLKIQSTDHVKLKKNLRGNNQPTVSTIPTREQQSVQPSSSLNFKKSHGQSNFLPKPSIIKGIRSVNTNDVPGTRESDLHNQVHQQTSGKLPQLRKILAPRCNK